MATIYGFNRSSRGSWRQPAGDGAAAEVEIRTGALRLSPEHRAQLAEWAASRTLPARVVLRSRIVLELAASGGIRQVAAALGVARGTVRLWGRRVAAHGPEILLRDAPGRGRKPALEPAVREMLRSGRGPNAGASGRAVARELGVSASTISRLRRQR